MTTKITQILSLSSEGLFMPSESDYPFEPFFCEEQETKEITPQKVFKLFGNPPDSPIEEISLEYLFRNVALAKEWHDEFQKKNVPRFQSLVNCINTNIHNVKVFRVGTSNIDVYIIGNVKNGFAGLKTKLIET